MKKHVLLAVIALSSPSHAQPPGAPTDGDRAAALFDEGKRHFDVGDYATAIAKWKESYLLSSEPLLLFNIGQAYRLAGNCAQANRFYLNYKRTADTVTNQAELDQAMAKCAGIDPAIGDADPKPDARPEPPDPPTVKPTETTMPAAPGQHAPITGEHDTGRRLRLTGLAIGGAGVAAGVVAIVFAVKTSNKADTVSSQPDGTIWTGSLPDVESSGRSAQTRARVFAAISGAALVGGGVLWWIGHRRTRHGIDVAVTPDHAEVRLSCGF